MADLRTEILERAERERVKFMRLQFTDILGVIKNVEVPDGQFADALDGRIMFDGSSIEGFVRIEESDMYLKPDLATFEVFPWERFSGSVPIQKSGAVRMRLTGGCDGVCLADIDEIRVTLQPHVFLEDFEGGGTCRWSSTAP